MKPIILFRKSLAEEGELEICRKYFTTIEYRSEISDYYTDYPLIIPRYSALPYYKELEEDVKYLGGTLINSYKQHKWIANFEWYEPLQEFTPQSWTDDTFFSAPNNQEYIVKGHTNSRKYDWNTMMYAPNKKKALKVAGELIKDSMIGSQGIVYRKYEPLKCYDNGINNLPFTDEWRFFFYKDQLLNYGYYWSISDYIPEKIDPKLIEFAQGLATNIVQDYVNFFVLDCAITKDDKPILIEVNCGTMSGLSECRPEELYGNLKRILDCSV